MDRLTGIGFQYAGRWTLVEGKLTLELTHYRSRSNVLYAFVSDGEVKYIGKTTQTLAARLYGCCNPGKTQATNIRNNRLICELLESGATVEVLALPDNGMLHYGPFHLNLAAALEDSLVAVIHPPWNGQPSVSREPETLTPPEPPVTEFVLILQKTYFNTGFFNVPMEQADAFGGDGEQIEIFCGDASIPLLGMINRRSNSTGSPRIMGGAGLRDWFQSSAYLMQRLRVTVHTPNEIRLDPHA